MSHVVIRSVRTEGACSLRRITCVVIRSARTEGGCRYGAHWMRKILNHFEMIEVGSHRLMSFPYVKVVIPYMKVGAIGYGKLSFYVILHFTFHMLCFTCHMIRS